MNRTFIRPDATVLGYDGDEQPIFHLFGGAVTDINVDDWIPIEYDSNVIQRVRSESAIEAVGQPYPMSSKTKQIPRSGGTKAHSGTTYTDDDTNADQITITARRFNGRVSVDEDDLSDANSLVNVMEVKAMDWASSYADLFDNACLGVSANTNTSVDGTTKNMIAPFQSAYYVLRNTTDSDLEYTADDNYLTWDDDLTDTSVANNLYDKLSSALGKLERGKYWSLADTVCIAAPGWREQIRNLKDNNGQPIFVDNRSASGGSTPDMLMGVPVYWSRGAKVAAKNVDNPSGNDLLFFANKRYLARGDRSAPESNLANARPQDDTDDASMKFRVRKAFALSHPRAAVVVERITD